MSPRVQTLPVESEQVLEQLIIAELDNLEEGLKFLDNQVAAGPGFIDILAVDQADKALVIIEIKKDENDRMLPQTLHYYDFVRENVERFARIYGGQQEIDPLSEPRIILIAHSFSDTLHTAAKYINASFSLFTFEYLQIGNQKGLLFTEIPVSSPKEFARRRKSVQEHLDYIVTDTVRELCVEFIQKVTAFDETNISSKGLRGRISIKYNGRNWIDIRPRREYFFLTWYQHWDRKVNIRKQEDLSDELLQQMKQAMQLLGGGDTMNGIPKELDEENV